MYAITIDRQLGARGPGPAIEIDMFAIKPGDVVPFGPWLFRVIEVRP